VLHLLLPPSETKTPGGRGRPLRSRAGGHGALDAAREAAVVALRKLVAGDPTRAAEALLLPDGVAAQALAANAAVLDSATTPALRRYSGVLYDGLAFAALTSAEQRLAGRSVLIFSGLFGVVRGDEPVPAYRVPAKAVLPGIGVAATFWRPVLAGVLAAPTARGLIVDLRSGDYAGMWHPARASTDRLVAVRVLSPSQRGGHAVISYNSKFAKGRLAAALIRRAAAGRSVADAEDVAAAWRDCGGADAVCTKAGLDLYTG
jgi:cytoplasmic iron level regulating protein YaaA (DUF328/UPF0246 family)